MSLRSWRRWWQALPQNPIYQREKGAWGKPNPFYDNLSRFSPFAVIGAIVLGLCTGFSNPALFAGNDDLIIFWCLICLPGALLSMLTLFGSLMAPALTAPTISMELNRGTWDILRLTPQSADKIIVAKLLGALSRLRIWPVLFALSLLQGLIVACTLSLTGGRLAIWGILLGLAALIRPWLEVLFAAFIGMYISTRVHSVTIALIGSYTGIVALKIFNSSVIWFGVLEWLQVSESAIVGGGIGPAAVYGLAIIILIAGLIHQTRKM